MFDLIKTRYEIER